MSTSLLLNCKHPPSNSRQRNDMTDDEKINLEELRKTAQATKAAAEKAWYAFAGALDVGPERTYAFDVYEQIRTATRRL